jgi:DNA-binding response OmpR family regulator
MQTGTNINYGKILVVEDDSATRETLRIWLDKSGFTPIFADTGPNGLQAFLTEKPDLVILDIMLPGMDGLEVCRKIRQTSTLPIVMLSARDDFTDKIMGLEVGADDYLAKPFHPQELVARVRAQLRRQDLDKEVQEGEQSVSYGEFLLDVQGHFATFREESLGLTPTEFGIFQLLASNPGSTYSRDRIIEFLWGEDFQGENRTVDSHVRNLRHKLKGCGFPDGLLESVWGVGYRLPRVESGGR